MTDSGLTPIRWGTVGFPVPRDYARADYASLYARFIRPARAIDARRRSLEPPAKPLLDWLGARSGIAVTGVV